MSWSTLTWNIIWHQRLCPMFCKPELTDYFAKSEGLFFWQQEPIVPGLMFGALNKIHVDDLNAALKLVQDFLEQLNVQKPNVLPNQLVQKLYGRNEDDPVLALQFAQLFAQLFQIFVHSPEAALICHTRYTVCRTAAVDVNWDEEMAQFGNLGDLPTQLALSNVKVTRFAIVGKGAWSDHRSVLDNTKLAVTLDIMSHSALSDIPVAFVPWVRTFGSSKLSYCYCRPLDDIFLSQNEMSYGDHAHNLFQKCYPANYNILLEEIVYGETVQVSVPVHDWMLASVFPYFAKALAAGLEEATQKTMTLRPPFDYKMLQAILNFATGLNDDLRLSSGKPFYIRDLISTDLAEGVEPYEEFGIFFAQSSMGDPVRTRECDTDHRQIACLDTIQKAVPVLHSAVDVRGPTTLSSTTQQ